MPTDLWSSVETADEILRDLIFGCIRRRAKIAYLQYVARLVDLQAVRFQG